MRPLTNYKAERGKPLHFCVSLVATSYNVMLNSMLAMGCAYANSHACGIGQMLMTSEQLNVIKCSVLLKIHIKV